MGDRVSISFKDKEGDESIAIFNHWGGTEFPKFAFDWFKEFKKSVNLTARENFSDPISRFVLLRLSKRAYIFLDTTFNI